MPPVKRIAQLVAALLAWAVYVWIAAVRGVPAAKRRRAAKRTGRQLRRPS